MIGALDRVSNDVDRRLMSERADATRPRAVVREACQSPVQVFEDVAGSKTRRTPHGEPVERQESPTIRAVIPIVTAVPPSALLLRQRWPASQASRGNAPGKSACPKTSEPPVRGGPPIPPRSLRLMGGMRPPLCSKVKSADFPACWPGLRGRPFGAKTGGSMVSNQGQHNEHGPPLILITSKSKKVGSVQSLRFRKILIRTDFT